MSAALRAKLNSLRAVIGAMAIAAFGALSAFDQIDLQPLVALFVKDQAKLGALMVGIAIFFGLLRYYAPVTPVPAVAQAAPDPVAKGVDEGT